MAIELYTVGMCLYNVYKYSTQKLYMTTKMLNQFVVSAVQREVSIGNFLVNRYKEKLGFFEKKYNIQTKDFLKKFESGELGDAEDYFEWFSAAEAEKHWENKLKELKGM